MRRFLGRPLLAGGFLLTLYNVYAIIYSMYEFIKQSLSSWSHQKDQRRKLQQAYLTVVLIGLILAGLLTLLNVPQSRLSAMIAAGFAVVYLVNGIAWALLEAFVAPNLPKPESTTNKKTRRQK